MDKEGASYDHSDDDSTSEDSFCLQIKIKQKASQRTEGTKGNVSHYQHGI